jgi:arsenate reductase
MVMEKTKVLFVCERNNARSQMAAAFMNKYAGYRFDAESAGLKPGKLNPYAIEAMAEIGIDISKNSTKRVSDFCKKGNKKGNLFNYVISVCDKPVAEKWPVYIGATKKKHWNFPEPAEFKGTETEKLEMTRKVRDNIKVKVVEFASVITADKGF